METSPRPHQFESTSGGNSDETHRSEKPVPRRIAVPIGRMTELSAPIPRISRAPVPPEMQRIHSALTPPAETLADTSDDTDDDDEERERHVERRAPQLPLSTESAQTAPESSQPISDEALLNELRADLARAEATPLADIASEVDAGNLEYQNASGGRLVSASSEAAPASGDLTSDLAEKAAAGGVPDSAASSHEASPVSHAETSQPPLAAHETIADPYDREVLFLPYDAAEMHPADVREALVPPAFEPPELSSPMPTFAREAAPRDPIDTHAEGSTSSTGAGESVPPHEAEMGGGAIPPVPPERSGGASFSPEPSGETPGLHGQNEGFGSERQRSSQSEQLDALHKRLENLADRNSRLNARMNRAVVTGLGLLGMERHFRRKGDKELGRQLAQSQHAEAESQRQSAQEQRRQTDEQYVARVQQERAAAAQPKPLTAEQLKRAQALGAERPPTQQESYLRIQDLPEHEAEQPYFSLEDGQEVRSSVWHNAVVKDGQVVEGAIAYGEGFKGEQRELRHDPIADDTPQAPVPTGVGAAFPYLSNGLDPSHSLTPGAEEQALPPASHTARPDIDHRLAARTSQPIASNATSPWFWLVLAIVVIGFLTAIAILH